MEILHRGLQKGINAYKLVGSNELAFIMLYNYSEQV